MCRESYLEGKKEILKELTTIAEDFNKNDKLSFMWYAEQINNLIDKLEKETASG